MKITWASVYRCERSLEMFSRIWKNWIRKIRLEEDIKMAEIVELSSAVNISPRIKIPGGKP